MIIPTKSKHIVMNLPVHSLNEEIITESMPLDWLEERWVYVVKSFMEYLIHVNSFILLKAKNNI